MSHVASAHYCAPSGFDQVVSESLRRSGVAVIWLKMQAPLWEQVELEQEAEAAAPSGHHTRLGLPGQHPNHQNHPESHRASATPVCLHDSVVMPKQTESYLVLGDGSGEAEQRRRRAVSNSEQQFVQ